MNNLIQIKNFSKTFGDTKSVIDLNLEVKSGEIYGFLGPNGAGKSTTIKTLVGIYKKDKGQISINNIDISDISYKQYIGYIPDEPYVYEGLNATQFLRFFAEMYSIDKSQIDEKIKEALGTFFIDEDINLQVQDFSRGSKQKLIIAAALMHNPKILIIDEPMVGLDPSASAKFLSYMKNFTSNGGAVFMSTHSLDIVTKICDRVGIIDHGKLKMEGSISDIEKFTKKNSLEEVFFEIINEK